MATAHKLKLESINQSIYSTIISKVLGENVRIS